MNKIFKRASVVLLLISMLTATISGLALNASAMMPALFYFDTWTGKGTASVNMEIGGVESVNITYIHEDKVKVIDSSNYILTGTEESTVITLKEEYLKTFTNGEYMFRAYLVKEPMMNEITVDLSLIVDVQPKTTFQDTFDIMIIIPGDADGDNQLTIKDATVIQKHIAKLKLVDDPYCLKCMDFNGDGKINIKDATQIQKNIAKLPYNCVVKPEELNNYNVSTSDEVTLGTNIPFQHMLNARNAILFSPDNNENSTTAIINSAGQFYKMFDRYSLYFDNEFFKENSLIVILRYDSIWNIERIVDSITRSGDTMQIGLTQKIPEVGLDALAYWHLFCSVKKADVQDVKNIIIKVNNV